MRQDDVRAIGQMLARIDREPGAETRVLIHSPCVWEIDLVRDRWPGARIQTVERAGWDLNEPPPDSLGHFDIVLVSNTFMYSPNPDLWLRNILDVASCAVIQDLCNVRRDGERYTTSDGDCARYSISHLGLLGKNDAGKIVYDLSTNAEIEIHDVISYGDPEPNQPDFLKFVAFIS